MTPPTRATKLSQAGLGKPACQYSGAEFRQRAKGLAKRLGEPVERLAALCEALATTNASRQQKPKLPARTIEGRVWLMVPLRNRSQSIGRESTKKRKRGSPTCNV